jgi:hypothetical protein
LIKHTLIALGAALMLGAPALAQEAPVPEAAEPDVPAVEPADAPAEANAQTLLPESVNLPVQEGSSVPADCHYPESINDTASFELACVTLPRFNSGIMGAQYLAALGTLGWQQGDYVEGGMTAVRTDENNCQRVLNIFPGDYPPADGRRSANVVVWFVLERAPRCAS